MKFFNQLADLFLFSNLFIALCAAAMTIETYLLLHSAANWYYIGFVFASTLALYNFPALLPGNFSAERSGRHQWITENKKLLIALFVTSLAGTIVLVFFFSLKFVLWFTPVAAVSFAYFFPQAHLRRIEGLKAGVVALVWTCVTVIYPVMLDSDFSLSGLFTPVHELIMFLNFLFLFPLAVIFNVRDIEADRKAGVRTIPVIYGVEFTILICVIFLLAFSMLVFFSGWGIEIKLGLLLSAIIAATLLLFASESCPESYYSFWVDGMILLQAVMVFLSMRF